MAERKIFVDGEVPELGHKQPLFYDVLQGNPFSFTSVDDDIRIQIQSLNTFLKGGGQLWMLDEIWTQVGFLTGNSASTSDFNWSQEHISVNYFVLVEIFYCDEIVPLIVEV